MLHSAGQEWARADGDALHPAFIFFKEKKSLKLFFFQLIHQQLAHVAHADLSDNGKALF